MIDHTCPHDFCPICDAYDEAMEASWGVGHSESLFRGDDWPEEHREAFYTIEDSRQMSLFPKEAA